MEPSTSSIRAHYNIEDAIEHLYDVTIFGRTILTTVTKYPEAVTEWINDVKPDDDSTLPHYVGFEINLVAGNNDDVISTVHLCVGTRCLVIQFLRMWEYPPSLAEFLTHPNNMFCGIDALFKIDILINLLCVEDPVTYVDLGVLAARRYGRLDLITAPHSVLFWTALGMRLEKPSAEGDWDRRGKLSEAQVECACIDAFVGFELGRWLIREGNN